MRTIFRQIALRSYLKSFLISSLAIASFAGFSQGEDTTNTLALQRDLGPGDLPQGDSLPGDMEVSQARYARRWGKLTTRERELIGNPQVALALSGGGARGLAHIGVLRAFEEAEIEIIAIAGTSMGGIVGGLYAAGISPAAIEDLATKIDFRLLFSNSPQRQSLFLTQRENMDRALLSVRFDKGKPSIPTGFSSAQRLTEMLSLLTLRQNYAAGADFTKLGIPFTTVATDISTGEAVALDHGNLADAIRATMAFPLAISPVEIDGRLLMDGGMVEPVPVELVMRLVEDKDFVKIVAVNTTKRLLPKGGIKDPFDMATQVTTIMSLRELREELELADYVITPSVGDGKGADFGNIKDFVNAGYREAQIYTAKILAEHEEIITARDFIVAGFTITGTTAGGALWLEAELNALRGEITSAKRLDEIFMRLWNEGDLIRLDVKSSLVEEVDSGLSTIAQPASFQLRVTATSLPPLEQIAVEIEDNFGQRQEAVEAIIQRRIVEFGQVDLDSIAEWTASDYRGRGIDLCAVRVCIYVPETKTLYLRIDEARSHELTIKGANHTRDSYIRDRMGSFVSGQPFTAEIARRAYRDIYGSGLFERVSIEVIPTEDGADVEVLVHERNTLQMQLGYRWDDEYHSEGFIKGLESNLLGIGLEGSVLARFADRRQRFSATLRTDRIFRTHVAFDIQAYATKLDRRLLESDETLIGFRRETRRGVSLRIGQQIARLGIVSVSAIMEHVEATEPGALFPEKYNLRKIQFHSVVEDFNTTYFTRKGRKHVLFIESAGKIFGGETEYTKWFSSIESYFPLTEWLNLRPKFTAAVSRANLPAPEKFYLGGLDSFEGFRTTELSGSKLLLMNIQLRFKVFPRVYVITRYNAGNTYGQTEELSIDNLRYGWAAALGLDTPFGPITFGYGRASESRDRVYFQAGLRF